MDDQPGCGDGLRRFHHRLAAQRGGHGWLPVSVAKAKESAKNSSDGRPAAVKPAPQAASIMAGALQA